MSGLQLDCAGRQTKRCTYHSASHCSCQASVQQPYHTEEVGTGSRLGLSHQSNCEHADAVPLNFKVLLAVKRSGYDRALKPKCNVCSRNKLGALGSSYLQAFHLDTPQASTALYGSVLLFCTESFCLMRQAQMRSMWSSAPGLGRTARHAPETRRS